MYEPELNKQNTFKSKTDEAPTISIKEAASAEGATALAQASAVAGGTPAATSNEPGAGKIDNKKSGIGKIDKEDVFIVLILAGFVAAAAYFHWGPFARPKVDYQPYISTVQKEIKEHWHPPNIHNSNRVEIHFKVQQNGEVTDVGLSKMSHIPDADAAALKAVLEAMPALPPLPAGADAPADVDFTFEQTYSNGK
jgi:TonB family protein